MNKINFIWLRKQRKTTVSCAFYFSLFNQSLACVSIGTALAENRLKFQYGSNGVRLDKVACGLCTSTYDTARGRRDSSSLAPVLQSFFQLQHLIKSIVTPFSLLAAAICLSSQLQFPTCQPLFEWWAERSTQLRRRYPHSQSTLVLVLLKLLRRWCSMQSPSSRRRRQYVSA